jgi:hypothetical protein
MPVNFKTGIDTLFFVEKKSCSAMCKKKLQNTNYRVLQFLIKDELQIRKNSIRNFLFYCIMSSDQYLIYRLLLIY